MTFWLRAELDATLVALVLIVAMRAIPRIPAAWRAGVLAIALVKLALPVISGPMLMTLPAVSDTLLEQTPAPNVTALWVLYALVVLGLGLRLMRRIIAGTTVLHGSEAPNRALALRFLGLADSLGLTQCTLQVSQRNLGPLAAGLWAQSVVIPANLVTSLTPEQLDAVLLHELAHHARRDLWLRLVSEVIAYVWWFNPVSWFLVRELRRTTEEAADDMAVAHLGRDVARYSDALVRAARFCAPADATFAPAAGLHPLGRRLLRLGAHAVATPTLGLAGWLFCISIGLFAMSLQSPPDRGRDGDRIVIRQRIVAADGLSDSRVRVRVRP